MSHPGACRRRTGTRIPGPDANPPRDRRVGVTAGAALARAGIIVSGAFLVSRVLGYVRLVVIGNTFGASADLDAFFAAFRIPDLIFQLVASVALSTALVPG